MQLKSSTLKDFKLLLLFKQTFFFPKVPFNLSSGHNLSRFHINCTFPQQHREQDLPLPSCFVKISIVVTLYKHYFQNFKACIYQSVMKLPFPMTEACKP